MSARIRLRRLIWVDTLRRGHNFGFLVGRLVYRSMNIIGLNSYVFPELSVSKISEGTNFKILKFVFKTNSVDLAVNTLNSDVGIICATYANLIDVYI